MNKVTQRSSQVPLSPIVAVKKKGVLDTYEVNSRIVWSFASEGMAQELKNFLTNSVIAKINWKNRGYSNMTPLHVACLNGHIDTVNFLLTRRNINLNSFDDHGNSPIFYAKDPMIVGALLEKERTQVNYINKGGISPLWNAIHQGQKITVALILLYKPTTPLDSCPHPLTKREMHPIEVCFIEQTPVHLEISQMLRNHVEYVNRIWSTGSFGLSKKK